MKRDAEIVLLLAQYNNCLVLRLMKVFSNYSELDYYKTCNTNVSKWYESKYKKMIDRGEVYLDFIPGYKLENKRLEEDIILPLKEDFLSIQRYMNWM